jgi:hypothetical protein
MDRRRDRRFAPSADFEGLEPRQYLSTVVSPAAERAAAQKAAAAEKAQAQAQARLESTLTQRNQRIDRLPVFMRNLQVGRFIPEAPLQQIQDQLRALIGQLTPPSESVNKAFIQQVRTVLGRASLGQADVVVLNQRFANVLTSAKAPSERTDALINSITEIARNDASSRNAVFLVANDYSLVMQTILATSKPLPKV